MFVIISVTCTDSGISEIAVTISTAAHPLFNKAVNYEDRVASMVDK
jgi:hypothetical protein